MYGINDFGDPYDLSDKIWPVGVYAIEDPLGEKAPGSMTDVAVSSQH